MEFYTKPVISKKKGVVTNAQGKPRLDVNRRKLRLENKGELTEVPKGQTDNNNA